MTRTRQQYLWVDDDRTFSNFLDTAAYSNDLGIDTEADSRHHYPEKTCLIQISIGENVFIIDPLADLDMSELAGVLTRRAARKVFHGADFDLRGLNRDWGFEIRSIYDTNIAARFAGLNRFGYAALLEDVLGIIIDKDQRLQRADWSKRPLPEDALQYAAADVRYLVPLRDSINERLTTLGRRSWVDEEFVRLENVRYVQPDRDSAFLSVKGSHNLDGTGLSVLKELWELRESEALRLDRPPSFIMSAEALVTMASSPAIDVANVKYLNPHTRSKLGKTIGMAIAQGLANGHLERPRGVPQSRYRMNKAEEARIKSLKAWRIAEGSKHNIDPSLLWPMKSLERLARDPDSVESEMESTDVRRWQRLEFEPALRTVLG